MTSPNIDYYFLTQAPDNDSAQKQVLHFLNHTDLITYDRFEIHHPGCLNGSQHNFWPCVEEKLQQNRAFSALVLEEIKATGVAKLEDLLQLAPGYPSKLLHILTHMIDGFISVDSSLYNLVEDSHQVSATLRENIQATPEKYWLIPVITGVLENSLLHPAPMKLV